MIEVRDGVARSIQLNTVGKVFEDSGLQVVALEGISFSVAPREFVSIIGPSGCGKSTLLRIIAGLISSTGEVVFGDRVVDGPLGDVGFVFQDATLMKWRTVLKNVMFPYEVAASQRKVRRSSREEYENRALKLLEAAGLAGFENAYPKQLSGGMQQRVSICRALLRDPPLLLMDEPFGALDELTREKMNDQLVLLCQETEKTVLFVTHHIPEAVFLADRVLVMTPRPGRIAEIVDVSLPRPRSAGVRESPEFHKHIVAVRKLITDDDSVTEESGARRAERT